MATGGRGGVIGSIIAISSFYPCRTSATVNSFKAGGWIKAGRQNRFIRAVVLARIAAGLFAKGLHDEGQPQRKLRAA